MRAALQILWQVASYRLRRLEMANMGGALAILLALRAPPDEIAVRLGFALLLNLLVYLNNDFHDLASDLRSPGRDDAKTRYLRDHRGAAIGAQLGLVAALAAIAALWDLGLLLPLCAGGGVCWLYSARLKHVPCADIPAMTLWGAAMLTVAFPPDDVLGWTLAGLLGLYSGVFEAIQVIRDHDGDLRAGVRTTAVALGVPRTLLLVRSLLVVGGLAAALVVHPLAALFPALATALPLGRPERYWNQIRVLLGLSFLLSAAWVHQTGATAGLLVTCTADACASVP